MTELLADAHLGFIVAAYAVAAVVIAGMIGFVLLDYRRLTADLDEATRALQAARGGSKSQRR